MVLASVTVTLINLVPAATVFGTVPDRWPRSAQLEARPQHRRGLPGQWDLAAQGSQFVAVGNPRVSAGRVAVDTWKPSTVRVKA